MNEETESNMPSSTDQRMIRCMDWLQKQNSLEPTKLSLQNKNDIQFIIQTNSERKNFLLAAAEDDATVPVGVNECSLEPVAVSSHKLRFTNLVMECEWATCKKYFTDYDEYQKHVWQHASELNVVKVKEGETLEYTCLWDVCGHKSTDYEEMVRHMNYHAYHGKLLAIGLNGRATLKLMRCKRDSTKRNVLPIQGSDYVCRWKDCDKIFNSIQQFLDHVKVHMYYLENFICCWAGCGSKFKKKMLLSVHLRSHTGERLIACYHCGQHFSMNRKLCDHLRRQNVNPNSGYSCSICGSVLASEYLLNEHTRQHISTYACSYCDMSATSPSTLARHNVNPNSGYSCSICGSVLASEYLLNEHTRQHISTYACSYCDMSATSPSTLARHVRYRHLNNIRMHACTECEYRAITKWDLRVHLQTHNKKRDAEKQKKKSNKKYVCDICPKKNTKIFSRGTRLTTHLVKVHGAQWSFGHSRFRYRIGNDGMYRLTTTRLESIEVSKKIMDGPVDPTGSLTNVDFDLKKVSDATDHTPRHFEITLKNDIDNNPDTNPICKEERDVVIEMCDVDDTGNIISSEFITSEVVCDLVYDMK